jgi:hypothetical protein
LCKHQPYLIVAISGHPTIAHILMTWVAVLEGYRLDSQLIKRISRAFHTSGIEHTISSTRYAQAIISAV